MDARARAKPADEARQVELRPELSPTIRQRTGKS